MPPAVTQACSPYRLVPWLAAGLLLAGCALPPLDGRTQTSALPTDAAAATRLGVGLAAQVVAHPGQTGILPLADAQQAFAARMLLARAAERTLDVQYYIWHDDITGTLLLDALRQAAQRGVRVRLLLDDNGIAGMDDILARLDADPRIEVRLFNPFAFRPLKALGYVTSFGRANRRMHNKSFTADNQATIAGGRNVGDEYFGATEGVLFADLDVLAVGAVVPDVSADFDRYWASASAYPLAPLLGRAAAANAVANEVANEAPVQHAAAQAERDPRAGRYLAALRQSEVVTEMVAGRSPLQWSRVTLVSDDPRKGQGQAGERELLPYRLRRVIGEPAASLDLVSPYFVPTASGVKAFTALAKRGVKIRILTNALEATDVAAVHAGYAKWRKALLQAGIELHEMRRQGEDRPKQAPGAFGSSGSSLHAKTFAVDGARVFVGSFNFDPRSAELNTEAGFVIDSAPLAARVGQAFDTTIPARSYAVRLDEHGRLYWLEARGGTQIRHDEEPGTSLWQRAGVGLLSLLPIDWLL